MQSPKISIIIPVYNQHKKLLECLKSIKAQTFQDFEVIIVNDGSTDASHEALCQKARAIIPSAKCFYQENQGAPTARNNGFAQSTGQYILFCDADIVMKPDMLSKMSKTVDENSESSYAYSSFKFGWKRFKLWEFDADKLRQMPYIHTTSLIRREHFPGFDPNLKRLQDWDLWLSMLEQGHVGQWIPEVLFTVKTGGTMSSWLPSFLTKWQFFAKNTKYQSALKIIQSKQRRPKCLQTRYIG